MAKSEDLKVKISLQDKLSSGLGKIGGNLEQLNQRTLAFQEKLRGNFDNMVAGVGTAIGAGASIYAAIMPNVELERSLSALKALGVDGELGAIRDSAQQFTKDFGGTSSEFINHAATMKRAIGDVNETELAQITSATAKLANATQSDVVQVSKYLGRLYHTYQDEADKIGKVDFISNMANMTAIAAKSFGVSADEMAGGMESISALAKNYSITLPEQIAVIGALQVEHSESDAASFYEAFIREGSKLKELGINTLDSQGQMQPILDILDQVKAKFGALDASEFELLDQTAGDAAMVIQTLLRQSDKLESSLSKMNLSNGTNELDAMAAHHTDVLKQLQGSWTAFSENTGQAVMPVVTVVGSALITGIDWINDFTQEFPHLTTAVIATVLVIAAFTTAISLGSAGIAMMRVGMTAMSPILTLVQSLLSTLTVTSGRYTLANVLSTAKMKLLTGAQWLQTLSTRAQLFAYGQLITLQMTVSNGYTSMTRMLQGLTLASIRQAAVTKTLAAGQAMLNLVMSLNPIGLLVAGLAIGGMMVMRYWEPIKAFFGGFIEGLRATGLFDAFAPLGAVFSWIWDCVTGVWQAMTGWLTPLQYANDELAGFASTGMMVGSMIGDFFSAIGERLMNLFNGVISLLNKIPGIEIELPKIDALVRDDSTITLEPASPIVAESNKVQSVQPVLSPLIPTQTPAAVSPTVAESNKVQSVPSILHYQYNNNENNTEVAQAPALVQPVFPMENIVSASPVIKDVNKVQNIQPTVNHNVSNNDYHTEMMAAIAPTQPVLTQSINTIQHLDPLKQTLSPVPQQGILEEQRKYSMQQRASNSLTTGDIHIHKALSEFSLLGLDEQRILTIG